MQAIYVDLTSKEDFQILEDSICILEIYEEFEESLIRRLVDFLLYNGCRTFYFLGDKKKEWRDIFHDEDDKVSDPTDSDVALSLVMDSYDDILSDFDLLEEGEKDHGVMVFYDREQSRDNIKKYIVDKA